MATVKPFPALRPQPELAKQICELPYDVMSAAEARALAAHNPLSFLHVSKAEIDFAPETDPHSPAVYDRAARNFQHLIRSGALRSDAAPAFYLYRQRMGSHQQTGFAAVVSCQEYLQNIIKKHELTRPDKEDDRVRHIETLNAQTGPAFLTYRSTPQLDAILEEHSAPRPEIDFVADDTVQHTAWVLRNPSGIQKIQTEFERVPALYIADGHHRSAAAARVFQARAGRGASPFFLAVIFPDHQLRILPYNRVLKDLNGHTPAQLLQKLDGVFIIKERGAPEPKHAHEIGLYLDRRWYTLHFRPHFASTQDPIEKLDVTLLQNFVLAPVFGIDDPRRSERIQFVGGIRGAVELEKLVNSGDAACAFSLFPTRINDLIEIADAGGIMPPKSTWFEPKLRDAMFCHVL